MKQYLPRFISSVFVFFLTVGFLSGCGFLSPGTSHPNKDPRPAPEIGPPDDSGRVDYRPTLPSTDAGSLPDASVSTDTVGDVGGDGPDGQDDEKCFARDVTFIVSPREIKSQSLDFVYKTEDFDTEVSGEDISVFLDADHVHLVSATMEIDSGDSFHFLEWVRIRVKGDGGSFLVAWGGPFPNRARSIDLDVDGAIDLRPMISDSFRLEGQARAKSPDSTTYIGATLVFRNFHGCM